MKNKNFFCLLIFFVAFVYFIVAVVLISIKSNKPCISADCNYAPDTPVLSAQFKDNNYLY